MDLMAKLLAAGKSRESARSLLFGLHGGAKQFDRWLSDVADMMAKSTVDRMQFSSIMAFNNTLERPHEIVDSMINGLDSVKFWDYIMVIQNGTVKVFDPICNHIIEEHPFTQDMLQSLELKYGTNDGFKGAV